MLTNLEALHLGPDPENDQALMNALNMREQEITSLPDMDDDPSSVVRAVAAQALAGAELRSRNEGHRVPEEVIHKFARNAPKGCVHAAVIMHSPTVFRQYE